MGDKEIESALRTCLADKVGQERFDLWFVPHTRLSVEGQTVVVAVANVFFQNWIRTTFRREIEAAGAEVLRQPAGVEFRIDPAVTTNLAAASELAPRPESACSTFCRHPDNPSDAPFLR